MWEFWRTDFWRTDSWRTYISFALVGAIFILCQALAGGASNSKPDDASADPGDRSYRESLRDETAGRGGMTLPNVNRPLAAAAARYTAAGEARLLTD
jgi:hypothetical protein